MDQRSGLNVFFVSTAIRLRFFERLVRSFLKQERGRFLSLISRQKYTGMSFKNEFKSLEIIHNNETVSFLDYPALANVVHLKIDNKRSLVKLCYQGRHIMFVPCVLKIISNICKETCNCKLAFSAAN